MGSPSRPMSGIRALIRLRQRMGGLDSGGMSVLDWLQYGFF